MAISNQLQGLGGLAAQNQYNDPWGMRALAEQQQAALDKASLIAALEGRGQQMTQGIPVQPIPKPQPEPNQVLLLLGEDE